MMSIQADALNPGSEEIIRDILRSPILEEKTIGHSTFALHFLYSMYTKTSRAAAYAFKVGEAQYQVVVRFSDAGNPFEIKQIHLNQLQET